MTQGDLQALQQMMLETINLVVENQINPKLEALAEGQQVLLDKLTSEERMEALEMEVELLKIAVRQHSDELAELKMAQ